MLPSSDMAATQQFTTAAYGMAAVFAWGTSDFLGGDATRRASSSLFAAVFNLGGLLMVGTLAEASHAPFLPVRSALWVLTGGICGGVGIAIFFRALSLGRMGLAAPIAAVLGAAIPTLFSVFSEGLPGRIPMIGFVLAAIGLWLISRTDDGGSSKGIGLAIIAGIGFASFYLCIRQAGNASVLWIASLTRTGGVNISGLGVLPGGRLRHITSAARR